MWKATGSMYQSNLRYVMSKEQIAQIMKMTEVERCTLEMWKEFLDYVEMVALGEDFDTYEELKRWIFYLEESDHRLQNVSHL